MGVVKIRSSSADKTMQILCLALMLGVSVYLIAGWSSFPEQVPMHYDGSGEIDRWGGKGEMILLILLWWGMYLVLSVIERVPQIWNTGVKVTAENQERVYWTLKYMIVTLKLVMTTFFAVLIINITLCRPLDWWYTPVFAAAVFGDMFFWIVRLVRAK